MQDFTNISYVFFDLDDTLWDFHANAKVGLLKVYEKHNLQEWFGCFDEFYNIYSAKNRLLWASYGRGEIEKSYLSRERFAYPLRCVGGEDGVDVALMGADFLRFTSEQTQLVEGCFEVLGYLHTKYRLGIISNGFVEAQYGKLERSGLMPFFDLVVLSDEVGVLKPSKGIFEAALQRSGCGVDDVLMIGDNWDTDIQGARGCGWSCVYFDRENSCKEAENSMILTIHFLSELLEML